MTPTTRPVNAHLCVVVLAAGGSSRLGAPKQLVRYRGRALLRRAVDAALATGPAHVLVVVGAEALRMRALLQRSHPGRVRIIHHSAWFAGLAGSLARGLAALPPQTQAVLVMLADQPLVDARAARRLVAAWSRQPLRPAVASYAGRRGVPAILPQSLWPQLRTLRGDAGARAVLGAARAVTAVAMPEAAVDIDTPQDVERLRLRTPRAFNAARRLRS